jgi:hypothetical protein
MDLSISSGMFHISSTRLKHYLVEHNRSGAMHRRSNM